MYARFIGAFGIMGLWRIHMRKRMVGMNKKQIEDLIYDYHWMRKEVDRLERIIFGFSVPIRFGVSQYGVEATLPKGSPMKSRAELEAMDLREERQYKRLIAYREKVYAVEEIAEWLEKNAKDQRQLIILDCMMEGMSYRAIAAHLRMNRNRVRELKDDMLDQICQKCQKCQFVQKLNREKSAV
jgi:CheY-like chemotaxis protein